MWYNRIVERDIMDDKTKIIELAKNNGGYLTREIISENNITKFNINFLVDKNIFKKVARTLYVLTDFKDDEFYVITYKNPDVIFSLETVLYIYGLSEKVPSKFSCTVPYNYSGILSRDENIELNYVSDEILNLGVMKIISPSGHEIKIYDLEKTICDIIKNKNKIDSEVWGKALQKYVKSKNKNLKKLFYYAEKMNVENKVMDCLDILLWWILLKLLTI